ncbi:urease accessory protein UreF [Acidisoma sp. 7E03]
MTGEAFCLLAALQFADGQFPGGAFAFSWGVESLMADGRLARGDWPSFLLGQMEGRWARFDRPLIAAAHAAAGDAAALLGLDDLAEAHTLPAAARTGSRRAGAALLGSHARLGTPGASAYRARVIGGEAPGHLPIVQGLVLSGAGLELRHTLGVAAHGTAQALGSAAIRLGLISAQDSQSALQALRPHLSALLEAPMPQLDEVGSFTPCADIAMMRHPLQPQQLFAN